MKKSYFLFTVVVALALTTKCFAQWTDVTNNEINYEFRVDYNWYGGGDDGIFDGTAEPVIRTDVWIEPYGWTGQFCHSWSCVPSCYDGGNGWMWWGGAGIPFNSQFATWITCYESDNSDVCNYYDDSDDFWEGQGTLRDGLSQIPIVYSSTDFRPVQWISALGNGGSGWLYPNTPAFDQIMALTWRYTSGDAIWNCLNFPTIYNGETKSDINSNRQVSTQSGYGLEYNNTTGQPSRDVWYAFTLNEKSTVTISTDHSETDFDTIIRLFDLDGNEIGFDDQGGNNNTSVLTTQLCAGTYKFCVEGYDNWQGLFRVTVTANTLPAISIIGSELIHASCASSANGFASWFTEGSLLYMDYWVNGAYQSANNISGLPVGDYLVEGYDGCGSYGSWNFTIGNADVTPPTAICNSTINLTVTEGEEEEITPDDIDNGSYDNCVTYLDISEDTFDESDEGSNVVTLTVTDDNGSSGTCTCNVNVEVITGVEESEQDLQFTITPNPNNGNFVLDLSAFQLLPDAQIHVADCTGRVIYENPLSSPLIHVLLHDAAPGIYLLNVMNAGQLTSARFVVQ